MAKPTRDADGDAVVGRVVCRGRRGWFRSRRIADAGPHVGCDGSEGTDRRGRDVKVRSRRRTSIGPTPGHPRRN